ncbi:MAG TPA: DNA mismatch repair protein MutS, partial [Candidatus Dormibacteraeota bacterium]|nr:DNA mismatch repair protein MutS [Candidatus Dormibacteraeota bacterium]
MTGAADTPILRQYREAKAGHPDGILLFRLGDFFEIFFEDAVVAAPVMGVTLTSRPMGKNNRSPMCGVPAHAWPTYVGKLLRAGFKVVLCDQVEAAHESKGIVRREVTRVLTPGTVLEEDYLEAGTSNYLVSWVARGGQAGLAACDLSAGELLLCQLPESDLPNELRRLNPVEVLTPPAIDDRRFDL